MAHGIVRGAKSPGPVHGVKHGSLIWTAGGNPMAGVTQDAASGKYFPSSAAEWTQTLSVAGIGSGGPTSLYLCQEASGNLLDTLPAGNTLTLAGAGHLFQQPVAGFTRLAATTVDGTAGQKWVNSTTSPDATTTSVLTFGVMRLPAVAPTVVRDLSMLSANADLRFNTTGKLRVGFGASVDLVNTTTATVRPVIVKIDNPNTISACYTDQEKLIGTYALPATAHFFALGGQSVAAGDVGYMYYAEFAGAAAQLTDAQVKSLLVTLGWTVPWS
jgi:hypothetical protein